jgi:hypothetical protein
MRAGVPCNRPSGVRALCGTNGAPRYASGIVRNRLIGDASGQTNLYEPSNETVN